MLPISKINIGDQFENPLLQPFRRNNKSITGTL